MVKKYSKREKHERSGRGTKELLNIVKLVNVSEFGANSNFYLQEFARAESCQPENVCVLLSRKPQNLSGGAVFRYYIYSWYDPEKNAILKDYEGVRWNASAKSFCIDVFVSELEQFERLLAEVYDVCIYPEEDQFKRVHVQSDRIDVEPEYTLLQRPVCIKIDHVLDSISLKYSSLKLKSFAIHRLCSESDEVAFGPSLPVTDEQIRAIEFSTRHPVVLFRVSLFDGRPRYLLYSGYGDEILCNYSQEAKVGRQLLAMVKNSQRRIGHHLLEGELMSNDKLLYHIL